MLCISKVKFSLAVILMANMGDKLFPDFIKPTYWRLIFHLQSTRWDPNSSNIIIFLHLLIRNWKERQASYLDKSRSFLTYRKGRVSIYRTPYIVSICLTQLAESDKALVILLLEEWTAFKKKKWAPTFTCKACPLFSSKGYPAYELITCLLHNLCHLPGRWRATEDPLALKNSLNLEHLLLFIYLPKY